MRVLAVASEAALIAKVGGLGDVLTGLSRELVHTGVDLLMLLPRYGCTDYTHLVSTGKKEYFQAVLGGVERPSYVEFFVLQNSIPVALLDTVDGMWFNKKSIYGYEDEVASFIYFSRLCNDWLQTTSQRFDVVHVHDWQTAFLSVLLKYCWKAKGLAPKTLLTLHNIEYQGKCSYNQLKEGFSDILNTCPSGLFADPRDDCANLLKGAILSSDLLTTVSLTYSHEIVTPEGGKGLDKVLQTRKNELVGILNGVDSVYWDPRTDSFLNEKYSTQESVADIVQAKKAIKKSLFEDLHIDLKMLEVPLISSVTRLVHQKGLLLLRHLFSQLHHINASGILLGTSFDSETTRMFSELDETLTHSKRGRVLLKSEESLAHRIFAASDVFVVPSLFEPCGLTQLVALRYGAIPVVRKTGGLADTIFDYSKSASGVRGNGFMFELFNVMACQEAVERALTVYRTDQESWRTLMYTGMQTDYSWTHSAEKYTALYRQLI